MEQNNIPTDNKITLERRAQRQIKTVTYYFKIS